MFITSATALVMLSSEKLGLLGRDSRLRDRAVSLPSRPPFSNPCLDVQYERRCPCYCSMDHQGTAAYSEDILSLQTASRKTRVRTSDVNQPDGKSPLKRQETFVL